MAYDAPTDWNQTTALRSMTIAVDVTVRAKLGAVPEDVLRKRAAYILLQGVFTPSHLKEIGLP